MAKGVPGAGLPAKATNAFNVVRAKTRNNREGIIADKSNEPTFFVIVSAFEAVNVMATHVLVSANLHPAKFPKHVGQTAVATSTQNSRSTTSTRTHDLGDVIVPQQRSIDSLRIASTTESARSSDLLSRPLHDPIRAVIPYPANAPAPSGCKPVPYMPGLCSSAPRHPVRG